MTSKSPTQSAAASKPPVRGSQLVASRGEAASQQLLELAERCEAATGPDLDAPNRRALADEIGHAVGATFAYGHAPDYLASLDAAMLLAGELDFRVQRVPEGCRAIVWIEGRNVGYDAHAATPALALCAAALRARAAQ